MCMVGERIRVDERWIYEWTYLYDMYLSNLVIVVDHDLLKRCTPSDGTFVCEDISSKYDAKEVAANEEREERIRFFL